MFNVMTSTTSSSGGFGVMIIWLVIMVGVLYFLMIRPQRKEQKRVNQMLSDMAVGDSVVTTSGFYGVLLDITDEDVIVEFGNNKNCRIPMRKSAIAQVEKAGSVTETAVSASSSKSDKGGKADKADKGKADAKADAASSSDTKSDASGKA